MPLATLQNEGARPFDLLKTKWRSLSPVGRLSILALSFIAIAVTLCIDFRDRITMAAYERIEIGMRLSEVEKLLGGPPGEYATRPTGYSSIWRAGDTSTPRQQWRGNHGFIDVHLNARGRVIGKHFAGGGASDQRPSVFLRMLRQFGLVPMVRE